MGSSSQGSSATSVDLKTITSNSLQDQADQSVDPSSLKLSPPERTRRVSVDFYEQVDERMSRNSCEYPAYQAKYVNQWLENGENSSSKAFQVPFSDSDESILNIDESASATLRDRWGKVIGIRGYPKNVRTQIENGPSSSLNRHHYNELKFDHTRLKSNYEKQIHLMAKKFKSLLRQKDHEIDLLKTIIANRIKGHGDKSKGSSENDLRRRLEQLTDKLSNNNCNGRDELLWQLEQDNSNLRKEIAQKQSCHEQELEQLRIQIDRSRAEPDQVMLLKLRKENSHLKDLNECHRQEFLSLKSEYDRLESELRNILSDQSKHNDERGKEFENLSLELNRLQVYQTKLESILDTERAIKSELERRVDQMSREQSLLRDRISNLNCQLVESESRRDGYSSAELKKMQLELLRWQEKCDHLMHEKSDISELLRDARCKLNQIESKNSLELERLNEAHRYELDSLQSKLKLSESNCTKLQLSLNDVTKKLVDCQDERDKLTNETMNLVHENELRLLDAKGFEEAKRKTEESEEQIELLRSQLRQSESRRRDLERERDNNLDRLQLAKQQLDQFRQRFKLLQETFDKFKASKKQELARLRVNLNLEHYNRQVAVGSIEKELRQSLRELDSMKCRFIRRFGASSSSATPTVSSSMIPEPATAMARKGLQEQQQQQCSCGPKNRDHRCSARRQCCANLKPSDVIEIAGQRPMRQQVNCSTLSGVSLSSSCRSNSNSSRLA